MCARGILLSDIVHDIVRSAIAPADEASWEQVCVLFDEMQAEGQGLLERDGVDSGARSVRRFIEARYVGQNHEVRVELDSVDRGSLGAFLERFAARHTQEYGYDIAGRPVETVNCRIQAIGRVARATQAFERKSGNLADAERGRRKVYFGAAHGWREAVVYRRGGLPAGAAIAGPSIIEEMSATTVMLPGQSGEIDPAGNIIIETGA
jgi:N-methylhydantoinase A